MNSSAYHYFLHSSPSYSVSPWSHEREKEGKRHPKNRINQLNGRSRNARWLGAVHITLGYIRSDRCAAFFIFVFSHVGDEEDLFGI
jgi:hypothetical protein